jgi:hypothetical protein
LVIAFCAELAADRGSQAGQAQLLVRHRSPDLLSQRQPLARFV